MHFWKLRTRQIITIFRQLNVEKNKRKNEFVLITTFDTILLHFKKLIKLITIQKGESDTQK